MDVKTLREPLLQLVRLSQGKVSPHELSSLNTQLSELTQTLHQSLLADPSCLAPLTRLALESEVGGVEEEKTALVLKQTASVELKKAVMRHWSHADNEQVRAPIQEALLQALPLAPPLLQRAYSRIIVAIAKQAKEPWSALSPFLQHYVKESETRAMATFLLFQLMESMIELFEQDRMNWCQCLLFILSSSDSNLSTKVDAMQALVPLLESLPEEDASSLAKSIVTVTREMIPFMIQVIQEAIQLDQEELVTPAMDVINSLLALTTVPSLLNKHLHDLVLYFIQIVTCRTLNPVIRVTALNVILYAYIYKKNKLIKEWPQVLQVLLSVGSETLEEEDDDVDYSDDATPVGMAWQVVHHVASSLAPDASLPQVLQQIQQWQSAPTVAHWRASMQALESLVEGSSDSMRPHLDAIVSLLSQGLSHSHRSVCLAACSALTALCDIMGGSVLADYHTEWMPRLMQLTVTLEHSSQALSRVHLTLDYLLEALEASHLMQYLPSLMERLMAVVMKRDNPVTLRASALGAMGSAAQSVQSGFIPFYDTVMPLVLQCLVEESDSTQDTITIQGVAIDAVASLANAVGKERFLPQLENVLSLLFTSLSKSPRLRECSFMCFAELFELFHDHPVMHQVYPMVMERFMESLSHLDEDVSGSGYQEEMEDSDQEETAVDAYYAQTALIEEMETTLEAMTRILPQMKTMTSMSQWQSVMEQCFKAIGHENDAIRVAGWTCLMTSVMHVEEKTIESTLLGPLIHRIMQCFKQEQELNVVHALCQGLVECFKQGRESALAQALIQQAQEALFHYASLLLQGKATCQVSKTEEEETLEETGPSEYESLLKEASLSLLSAMSQLLNEQFMPHFESLVPILLECYQGQSVLDKSAVMGTLGEFQLAMKRALNPRILQVWFPLIMQAMQQQDDEHCRSNAIFTMGTLILYNNNGQYTQEFQLVLSCLEPLLKVPCSTFKSNIVDNACGCVARMILSSAVSDYQTHLQLDQVLPVLLQHVPLTRDLAENEPLSLAFIQCLESQKLPHFDHSLLQALFLMLVKPVLDEESMAFKTLIVKMKEWCHKREFQQTVESWLEKQGDEEKKRFMQWMQ